MSESYFLMSRNLTYDGLRGWLLIIIACNHLFGCYVPQITRTPLGFVSAAEAFVFLSGFVAYLVYSRLSGNKTKLKQKIWRRSFTIYGFHIAAISSTFLLVWLFPIYKAPWTEFFNATNWFQTPINAYLSALLLLEQPGFHDILILYLVPMCFLPFAIIAIKNGKATYVFGISVAVWLGAQFVTIEHIAPVLTSLLPSLKVNVSYFDPLAWQIYFYTGVLLSYFKFDKDIQFNFSTPIKLVIFAVALLFFVARHWFPEVISQFTTGHGSASLLYQINLLVLAYCVMLLMRKCPSFFTLRYPVFLGQHALPVFIFHTVVVYFLLPWSQPYTTQHWYWDIAACGFFVLLLSLPAWLDSTWSSRKKRNMQCLQVSQ